MNSVGIISIGTQFMHVALLIISKRAGYLNQVCYICRFAEQGGARGGGGLCCYVPTNVKSKPTPLACPLCISDSLMGSMLTCLVLGDMLILHIVLSSACEIADTQYYHANLFIYPLSFIAE